MAFSKKARVIFSIILLIGSVIRMTAFGWNLLILIWIIIPFYFIHILGQVWTIRRSNLGAIDKFLVYLSTIIFIFLTLAQVECSDNRCLFMIDASFEFLFRGAIRLLPDAQEHNPITWLVGTLFVLDFVMNIILLIRLRITKVKEK